MREREDGQTKCFNSNFVWGGFFSFFKVLKDFSMEKGPNSPYFKIKENPRCQIFNISSRRLPRIQRDPYVFVFSYMVYHQIWLILRLASYHFVYTTKLNKRENKEKNTGFRGLGQGGEKEVASYGMWLHSWGKRGSFHVFIRGGGQGEAPILVLSPQQRDPDLILGLGSLPKKTFMLFTFDISRYQYPWWFIYFKKNPWLPIQREKRGVV